VHSRYTITVANNLPHRYRSHDAVLDDLPRETLDQIASVGSDELLKVTWSSVRTCATDVRAQAAETALIFPTRNVAGSLKQDCAHGMYSSIV
jgi:hypothetical protein